MFGSAIAGAVLVLVSAGPLPAGGVAAPPPSRPGPPRTIVVAADGSGDVSTIQAAVDAVPPGNSTRVTIRVRAGVYRGAVSVPADKPFITLVGATGRARDVVITDDRANGTPKPGGGTWGTSGSATATLSADDFTARHLTFENSFDEQAHPEITNRQAVAVLTRGDRMVFDRVRFLGNQDTLYANTTAAEVVGRQLYRNCYVEGDVDFVFGRATAVFDGCEFRSLTRGSDTNNGYVTAASTSLANPYGFLITRSRFTSDAPARTVHLGRPWHPSNDPNAVGQVVIRDSRLDAHVLPSPWTDMSGWSWRDARFAEYRNRGAGAGVTADRPQLTAAEAARLIPGNYLAGDDGWHPTHH